MSVTLAGTVTIEGGDGQWRLLNGGTNLRFAHPRGMLIFVR